MTKCGHKTCANTQAAGKLFALCLSALQLVLSQHQIETRRDISIRVFLFTQASPGFILHQTLLVHLLSTHCEGDTKGEFYHWNWPYLEPNRRCAISLNTSCEIHTHTQTHTTTTFTFLSEIITAWCDARSFERIEEGYIKQNAGRKLNREYSSINTSHTHTQISCTPQTDDLYEV